jgi:hypothetical protein
VKNPYTGNDLLCDECRGIKHDKLIKAAAQEVKNAPVVKLTIDVNTAMVIVGALQLALRHPGFAAKPSAKAAKGVAVEIGRQISQIGPNMAEMVALGWIDQNQGPGIIPTEPPHRP